MGKGIKNKLQKKHLVTTGAENLQAELAQEKEAIMDLLKTFGAMKEAAYQKQYIDPAIYEYLALQLQLHGENYEKVRDQLLQTPQHIAYTGQYNAATTTHVNPFVNSDANETRAPEKEKELSGSQKAEVDVFFYGAKKYLSPHVEKAITDILPQEIAATMPEAGVKATTSVLLDGWQGLATGEWSAGEIAIGAAADLTGIGEAVALAMLLGTLYDDFFPSQPTMDGGQTGLMHPFNDFKKSQEPFKAYTDMINAGFIDKNHPENTNPGQIDIAPAWETGNPDWEYIGKPNFNTDNEITGDSIQIASYKDPREEINKIRERYQQNEIKNLKTPTPTDPNSHFGQLSRGINLSHGDQFNGSWNAALDQQYPFIAKPPDQAPASIFSRLANPQPYTVPADVVKPPLQNVFLQSPLSPDQRVNNTYELHKPPLPAPQKTPAKTIRHKGATPPAKSLHLKHPATNDKGPQAIAADEQHSGQQKNYHITINNVHGSHIKAQHITETKEQTNTTTEALAIALRSAVVANQLHAG